MDYRIREYGQGSEFGQDEVDAVAQAFKGDTLAYGPLRNKFEAEFAAYIGVERAVSVTNATTGLWLATQLLRIGEGDEVICTPQTFRATVLSLWARKVTIRFADIQPRTLNIDPDAIEDKITDRTKAIYLVHYGGCPVEMDRVMAIARKHRLAVVEDCAHATGAEYHGRKIGCHGDIAVYSFHSLKNMSLGGEGGMMVINQPELCERARWMRSMATDGDLVEKPTPGIGPYQQCDPPLNDHSKGAWTHDMTALYEVGSNLRISEVQAAIGSVQLPKLDGWNARRRKIAQRLDEGLSQIDGIGVQEIPADALSAHHLYVAFYDAVKVGAPRDDFLRILDQEKRIQIIPRYFPVHLLVESRHFGHAFGECPVTERVFFEEQVNLPINPRMTEDDCNYIVRSVREAIATLRS